jgi:predicted AlkP superfamily phosphohydrolase/phosphomutase
VRGREPEGAVSPEEYEAVRGEIISKLRRLVDPSTGQFVDGQIITREEVYHGKHVDEMPDLVYLTLEKGYIIEQPMALPFVSNRVIIDDPKISGTHRMHGVLLAKGPWCRKGASLEGATLLDLAPTVLHLAGCRVPDDMDGRVLAELFDEGFLKDHPIVYCEAGPEKDRHETGLSSADQEVILSRLKGLGYID